MWSIAAAPNGVLHISPSSRIQAKTSDAVGFFRVLSFPAQAHAAMGVEALSLFPARRGLLTKSVGILSRMVTLFLG